MLGFYGIMFELYSPGTILPGIIGVISLILAFYSLQTLPVNYAGMALIGFALLLFLLEIKIASHGVLAIGGIISLILGSMMLIRTGSGEVGKNIMDSDYFRHRCYCIIFSFCDRHGNKGPAFKTNYRRECA